MFKNKLYSILEQINACEKEDDIMYKSVSDRLNSSLMTYYKNLLDTCSFLLSKSSLNMLKKINKQFKEEDK